MCFRDKRLAGRIGRPAAIAVAIMAFASMAWAAEAPSLTIGGVHKMGAAKRDFKQLDADLAPKLKEIYEGVDRLIVDRQNTVAVMAHADEQTDMPLITVEKLLEEFDKGYAALVEQPVALTQESVKKALEDVARLSALSRKVFTALTVVEDRLKERTIFGIVVLVTLLVFFAVLLGYRNMGMPQVAADDEAEDQAPGALQMETADT